MLPVRLMRPLKLMVALTAPAATAARSALPAAWVMTRVVL